MHSHAVGYFAAIKKNEPIFYNYMEGSPKMDYLGAGLGSEVKNSTIVHWHLYKKENVGMHTRTPLNVHRIPQKDAYENVSSGCSGVAVRVSGVETGVPGSHFPL